MINKRKLIGHALTELVEQARTGRPKVRVGLMSAGSELGMEELLHGAALAMRQDAGLQVVAIGARISGDNNLEWIETHNSEAEISTAMESALDKGLISGAVALHYPFPLGVTTIGRVVTPARGKPLLIASSTGMSATSRTEAMLRNAILGIAVAKSLGFNKPTIGILNLDGAVLIQHALVSMSEHGYDINFGSSIRADGGILLRGNDLLAGIVDICVCDTLTGNVLMKLLSAFNTGGSYEALGWGYGPSVGENWGKIVSIISRTSGAPVIANALCYTASLIRGKLVHYVKKELEAAKAAGLDEIIHSLNPEVEHTEKISMPSPEPPDFEINGIDVLSLETAVKELWKVGIYAESGMGCTGPVIKIPGRLIEQSMDILRKTGYL
jgi:hypothetical protein